MSVIEQNQVVSKFLDQKSIPAFINGKWVGCSGDELDVLNPASGKKIAAVSAANSKDVDNAATAADKAFSTWSEMSVDDRAALLHRFADAIDNSTDILAELEALDVGKPIQNARGFDVPFGAECFRYFADLSLKVEKETVLNVADMEARVHRSPYGACGFIFPWNFPLMLFCWGVAPALAAGNTVVVKASEVTPLSTLYFGQLAIEAGIPEGVINIITGTGIESGQPLAEHSLIKRISFTGSTNVGKLIGRICGERLIPCKLELGGKGAAVIFEDADLDASAESLAGAITLNTGQVCCTATRWLVHEDVYDSFVEKVSACLNNTKIGHGMEEETQMGPLVSKVQQDSVQSYYEKGIADGADVLVPLEKLNVADGEDGFFVSPHLLTGDDNNTCFKEEVFGPTAYIVKFKDEDDVVRRVNSIEYGLANSIWTADLKRADRVAEKLISGNNWINAHNVFAYGLPYGGVNQSGFGGGVNSPETYYDYLRNTTIARPL